MICALLLQIFDVEIYTLFLQFFVTKKQTLQTFLLLEYIVLFLYLSHLLFHCNFCFTVSLICLIFRFAPSFSFEAPRFLTLFYLLQFLFPCMVCWIICLVAHLFSLNLNNFRCILCVIAMHCMLLFFFSSTSLCSYFKIQKISNFTRFWLIKSDSKGRGWELTV